MTLEIIKDTNSTVFERAFEIYELSFPYDERRDRAEHERIMKHPDYRCALIMRCDELLGIAFYWELPELIFLEHLATHPEIRGQGIGSGALELLRKMGKTVILEIEPPVDELTYRRYGFYKRNGFTMNPHHHIQAKYHEGDSDLELKILTSPEIISDEKYRDFYSYMIKNVDVSSK